MSNEFLEAALQYASIGWPVFPLWPKSKNPATEHGFKDAVTNAEQIKRWWTANPNYNIGIATGNGLCVIDVDDKPEKHGGLLGSDFLRDWELDHGEISETCCAKSGTGGMHYYFNVGDTYISGCQSDTIFIDLRCDGNYIVAPPSIHPDTGQPYTWDISPDEILPAKVTTVDKACIDWVYKNRKGADKDGNTDTTIPSGQLKEGEGRNEFLFKQGRSARGKGADDDTVAAFLIALNNTKCQPPLDEHELQKTIKSVCSVPAGMSEEAKETKRRGRPRRFDHAAIAKQLITENGACFVDGMPAIRNDKLYEIGWKAVSREIIRIRDDATRTNQKEVQHYLMVMAEQKQQSDPALIAFKNGVLDIRTMELRNYTDDDVIPNIIPHDWNENAECQIVDDVLLKMACCESDVLESLMEVIGVCMYRSPEFTQSAILLGEGSNGKSTYIRMIQALLGVDNISSLDMSMLGKQFHTGQLAGKLANLGDDISNEFQRGDLLSIFKKLVDGNRIYADVKGIEGFEFCNYATLVFSANEFPRLADYTDGMLRRIFPIEFNARFSKTDADYDPRISRKITTEKACQRLAVLGIMGLKQVIANNGFTPNSASNRRVEEIKADNNSVLSWALEMRLSTESMDGSPSVQLYKEYKSWCEESGFQAVSRTKFSRQINKEFSMKTVDEWINGTTKKVFRVA